MMAWAIGLLVIVVLLQLVIILCMLSAERTTIDQAITTRGKVFEAWTACTDEIKSVVRASAVDVTQLAKRRRTRCAPAQPQVQA